MAATERPPLRGASVETRVLAVEDGAGARAPRPPGRRGAARDPRRRPGPGGRARRGHDAHAGQRLRAGRGLPALRGPAALAARARRDQVLHRRRARRAGLQRRHGAPAPPVRRRARAAQLLRDVELRRLRQGVDRLDRGRLRAARRTGRSSRRQVIGEPARATARRAAHVRAHGRPARHRAVHAPTAS